MLFDRYDFSPQMEGQFTRKALVILELQKQIGIQVANVGDQELAVGLKFVEKAAAQGFPFVSANLRDKNGNPTRIPAYRIVEVAGIRVGVFGLLQSNYVYQSNLRPDPDFKVLDPFETARETVDILHKQGVALIIALSNIGLDDNKILASKAPGINFIISGHDDRILSTPERVGETLIFQAFNRGMYLGEAMVVLISGDTHFADLGERKQVQNEIATLDAQQRIFAGAITQMPEVRAKLSEMAQRSVVVKERAKELLKASSRVENILVPLDTTIPERADIVTRIANFKAKEEQLQKQPPAPKKCQ